MDLGTGVKRVIKTLAWSAGVFLLLFVVSLIKIHKPLPADQAFGFMTEQGEGGLMVYQTGVKVSIRGSILTVGYTQVQDTTSIKFYERFKIVKDHGNVVEVTDKEGRVNRLEFFRDADKVVVGARLTRVDRVQEFLSAER